MCRWMGSHFHDWIDYNGVVFSIEFTRMGSHIFCFFGVREFFILAVSKRTRMILLLVFFSGAPAREARVGQSPILMEYGQPLFFWLSRD